MGKKLGVLLLGTFVLLNAVSVSAYLDPGSGGLLLQVLFGGLVTAGIIVKTRLKKFKNIFRRKTDQS